MDIDIDFPTTFDPKKIFPDIIRASMIKKMELVAHPCGVYFQSIPIDISGSHAEKISAIPYKDASEHGAMKIDFLHLSILNQYSSKSEIRDVMEAEVDWTKFEQKEVVEQLFQIHNNFDIVSRIKPTSIIELADCIAIIRPGKRELLSSYLKDRDKTRPQLYRQDRDSKSAFRKSHALSYAYTILLQLHKLETK